MDSCLSLHFAERHLFDLCLLLHSHLVVHVKAPLPLLPPLFKYLHLQLLYKLLLLLIQPCLLLELESVSCQKHVAL